MLCEIKLRLTSPLLGQQRDPSGIRRFTRTHNKALAIDLERWIWAFNEAAEALHLGVLTDALHPSDGIASPTLDLHHRHWVDRKSGREQQKSEMFECVRKGTVLTFRIAVTCKDKLPPPTQEQLKAMFNYIGEFIGISQWGNRFGYGRFTVEAVNIL